MGYKSPSFLDTEAEHDNWHKGLYKGLKIQRPDKLAKNLLVYDKGWREWYHDDNHYHDFAMLGGYIVKAVAVYTGLWVMAALGI